MATFGEESKVVDICPVSGSLHQWHLYIDNYYQGQFLMRDGRRTFEYQKAPEWSTGDDIGILVDIFYEVSGEQP